jgi:DNA polymerase III subunit delta
MLPDQIIRNIDVGEIAPFYFLYGLENFYRIEIVHALSKKLITVDNKDFNLEKFEAKDSSVGDWVGAAKTISFMGGVKLIIVQNLHETILGDSDQKILLDYVASPATDTCLVITAYKADLKQKIYKNLKSAEVAVCCEATQEAGLTTWLKRRSKSFGYELSLDAAQKMVNNIGAKPGILAKELEKVMNYAGKEKKIIGSMVGELVGEIKMENAFALTEAIKMKRADKALTLLHNQLEHGEEPVKILGLIAWQFRVLWEVKYYQTQKFGAQKIANQMGSKLFLIEKALRYTKNFNSEKLKEGMKYLFEADRELKTSGKDPQGVLESLLLRLCSG